MIASADAIPCAFFHDLIGILEPFIYGFVIAYVLRPTCRWWEKELRKLLARAVVCGAVVGVV